MAMNVSSGFDELTQPPPSRGWGIRTDAYFAGWVLIIGGYLVVAAFLVFPFLNNFDGLKQSIIYGFPLSAYVSIIPIALIAGIMLYFTPPLSITRSFRRHYPAAAQIASTMPDPKLGERLSQFIPSLNIANRKLFMVISTVDKKLIGIPSGIIVVDEAGKLLTDDDLVLQAFYVYDFAMGAFRGQGHYGAQLRRLQGEIRKEIPGIRKVLREHQTPLNKRGMESFAEQVVLGAETLNAAFHDYARFLNSLQAYYKAAGYGWISEYYEQDANRYWMLQRALGKKLISDYQLPMRVTAAAAIALIDYVKIYRGSWPKQDALLKALGYLVEGQKIVDQWIFLSTDGFEKTNKQTLEVYHKKMNNLRARGRVPNQHGHSPAS